jgi:uncharacterized protein YdaL
MVSSGLVLSAHALVSPLPGSIVALTLPNLAGHQWSPCASGAPPAGSIERRRILLLHDQDLEGTGAALIQATLMENLASHFGRVRVIEVRNYRVGEILHYDAVIYIGSSYRERLSEAFRRDVDSGKRPVLWLKENIDQLTDPARFQSRYGWLWRSFEGPSDFTVRYKNAVLRPSGEGVDLTTFAALDRKRVQTLATATTRSNESIPWAVTSRHLTYIGDIPLGTTSTADASLALADLLHDVVPAADPVVLNRHRALVRIEDIGPMSNPDDLRAIAAALKAEAVPYSIAVYPLYVGPVGNGRQRIVHLAERPRVVRAIVEMLDGGASLVLHGYSHQLGDRKNPRSGESGTDYEFFSAHLDDAGNVVYDGPVPGDSQAWAQERIEKALAELRDLGLPRPNMFNVPHYAASPADYAAIRATFPARYDRGQYFSPAWDGTPPVSPYIFEQSTPFLVRDDYGSLVVPENLGYIADPSEHTSGPNTRKDLLVGAAALLTVRDSVASFFYHPFLGSSRLVGLVRELKKMGYTFTSPCEL